MAIKTYQGVCHCGAVRFEADIDISKGTNKCNCSTCTKARAWFAIVPPDAVKLLKGADAQTEYNWVPPGKTGSFLHFRFCCTCGVRTFGVGGESAREPKFCFVNIAALEDVDADELAAAPTNYVDGRHDKFNEGPADTRLL